MTDINRVKIAYLTPAFLKDLLQMPDEYNIVQVQWVKDHEGFTGLALFVVADSFKKLDGGDNIPALDYDQTYEGGELKIRWQ